jgi:hypothetical protein
MPFDCSPSHFDLRSHTTQLSIYIVSIARGLPRGRKVAHLCGAPYVLVSEGASIITYRGKLIDGRQRPLARSENNASF